MKNSLTLTLMMTLVLLSSCAMPSGSREARKPATSVDRSGVVGQIPENTESETINEEFITIDGLPSFDDPAIPDIEVVEDSGKLLWEIEAEDSFFKGAVVDGMAIVGKGLAGKVEKYSDYDSKPYYIYEGTKTIQGIDIATKKVVWEYDPKDVVIGIAGKAGNVVCYRKSKELLVLDAKTGSVLQQKPNVDYSLKEEDYYGSGPQSKGMVYEIEIPYPIIKFRGNPVTSKTNIEHQLISLQYGNFDFSEDGKTLGIFAFPDPIQMESYPHMVRKYSLYCFDGSAGKFLWKNGNYWTSELRSYIGLSSWWQEGSIFYGKSRVSYTRIDPVKGKMLHSEYGDNIPGVVTDGKYVCVLSCGDNDNIDGKPKKSKLSCYLLPEFK